MSKFREGGPVFPFEYHNQTRTAQPAFFHDALVSPGASQQFAGMTMRQHYAAHAPVDIPDWFTVSPASLEPEALSTRGMKLADREQFNSLRNGTLAETSASLEALTFYRDFTKREHERSEWRERRAGERYFAWRWHYADMMLSTEPSPA